MVNAALFMAETVHLTFQQMLLPVCRTWTGDHCLVCDVS